MTDTTTATTRSRLQFSSNTMINKNNNDNNNNDNNNSNNSNNSNNNSNNSNNNSNSNSNSNNRYSKQLKTFFISCLVGAVIPLFGSTMTIPTTIDININTNTSTTTDSTADNITYTKTAIAIQGSKSLIHTGSKSTSVSESSSKSSSTIVEEKSSFTSSSSSSSSLLLQHKHEQHGHSYNTYTKSRNDNDNRNNHNNNYNENENNDNHKDHSNKEYTPKFKYKCAKWMNNNNNNNNTTTTTTTNTLNHNQRNVLFINFYNHKHYNVTTSTTTTTTTTTQTTTKEQASVSVPVPVPVQLPIVSMGVHLRQALIWNEFHIVDYNVHDHEHERAYERAYEYRYRNGYKQDHGEDQKYDHKHEQNTNHHQMRLKDMNLTSFHRIFYMVHSVEDILDLYAGWSASASASESSSSTTTTTTNAGANTTTGADSNDNSGSSGSSHRIEDSLYQQFFTQHDILCKLRIVLNDNDLISSWTDNNNHDNNNHDNHNDDSQIRSILSKLDKKQILIGHPDDSGSKGTFIGSYQFDEEDIRSRRNKNKAIRSTTSMTNKAHHGKVGLVKFGEGSLHSDDDEYWNILSSLVQNNFTMHVVCDAANDEHDTSCLSLGREGVIVHENLTEGQFIEIVSNCAFTIIGKNVQLDSPSVWISLAYGTAVLNSNQADQGKESLLSSQLNKPYLYNISFGDTESVIQAAGWAVTNRFESYIPSQFRRGTMNDRVCALLEDDSLCSCPNPTFAVTPEIKEDLYKKYGKDSQLMDCRGNMFVKKGPTFSALD